MAAASITPVKVRRRSDAERWHGGAARSPIRIGALDDVTHIFAADVVNWVQAGLQLAFDEGLSQGRLSRPIELISEMTAGLPSGTAEAVEASFARLESLGVLAVVGPGISDNALIAQPLSDRFALPIVNWSGSEHTRGNFAFHYQVGSLPEEGMLLAQWLASEGHQNIAVIRERSPIGEEYFEYFQRRADVLKLKIQLDLPCSVGASEADALVARAKAARVDALVSFGLKQVLPIAEARLKHDWDVPVATNTAMLVAYRRGSDYWRRCEGWVYVDMIDETNSLQCELHAKLAAQHGISPQGVDASAGYDMGRLIVEGLANAPDFTRTGLRGGLECVKRLRAACGGSGTMMGFGPWDHAALKGENFLVLRQVRAGKSVLLSAF